MTLFQGTKRRNRRRVRLGGGGGGGGEGGGLSPADVDIRAGMEGLRALGILDGTYSSF
jgi:hypothetical protein